MARWNPWHGCHKISPGCLNCYVYRMDRKYEKDSSVVHKTQSFRLPVMKKRDGTYKIPSGEFVWTCFTSDFLIEEADEWRREAWAMIKERSDLHFLFITKRIDRFLQCIPEDWGSGYPNITVCCTVENQRMAEERLPVFAKMPIAEKNIICEPLLEEIDLSPYLGSWVKGVSVGGESGEHARICDYEWVLRIREQCIQAGVPFCFRQTGARLKKDGRIYRVKREYQHVQAKQAGIDIE